MSRRSPSRRRRRRAVRRLLRAAVRDPRRGRRAPARRRCATSSQVTYKDTIERDRQLRPHGQQLGRRARAGSSTSGPRRRTRGSTETRCSTLFDPARARSSCGSATAPSSCAIVKGTSTTLEPTFPAGGAPTLTVRALNVLHKLRTKQYRDHWTDKRISEIAQDIGRRRPSGRQQAASRCRSALAPAMSAGREPQLDYVAQDNQYDIDFLLLEARKIGYVVYVDREPQRRTARHARSSTSAPRTRASRACPTCTYELKWGMSLIDFKPKLSTANQVKSVEVRSWDRAAEQRDPQEGHAPRSRTCASISDLLHLVDPGAMLQAAASRARRSSSTSRSSRRSRPSGARWRSWRSG